MLGFTASDDLISRIIRAESAGNPNAVSPAGAIGLMQIMPATARDPGFGVDPVDPSRLRDPGINKAFGTEYYNAMLNRYGGDEVAAAAAYNAGPGVADRFVASGKDPSVLPAETRNYIKTIFGGDMPQSLALERASFTDQAPGDRGAGQIPQGALGFAQNLPPAPPAPSVANPPQLQAPAPSKSLLPTFQDNPIGAIALVLDEFTSSLLGKPSPAARLQELQIKQRRIEMEEYRAGLDIFGTALDVARSGGLEAGFSLIDGAPIDDARKGEFKNFIKSTVELGERQAAQALGVLQNPAVATMVNAACGTDLKCIREYTLDPKKFETLQAAADRLDMPTVQAKVDQVVKQVPQILEGIAEGGVTYSELSNLLRQVREQNPKAFTPSEEQTLLRNAGEILAPYGLTFVPQEEEAKQAGEIAKEGREMEAFKEKERFKQTIKPPSSDLVDESGNLKNEVSSGIQRQAAALVGGGVNSFGEFIGLTPETAQQALEISVAAEQAIKEGRATSIAQAVQVATKSIPAPAVAEEVAQPEAPQLESVPKGVDIAQATGVSGLAGRALNKVLDFLDLGLAAPEVEEATNALTKLQTATSAALARGVKDRPAQELINQFKEEFAVSPNMAGDQRAFVRLQSTLGFLRQRLAVQEDVLARPGDFKKEDISAARLSSTELKDLIASYEQIVSQFNSPNNPRYGLGDLKFGELSPDQIRYLPREAIGDADIDYGALSKEQEKALEEALDRIESQGY